MGTQMTDRPLRSVNGPGLAAAVVVAGLRKCYGTVQAVRDVSFTVEEGEIFALAPAGMNLVPARQKHEEKNRDQPDHTH